MIKSKMWRQLFLIAFNILTALLSLLCSLTIDDAVNNGKHNVNFLYKSLHPISHNIIIVSLSIIIFGVILFIYVNIYNNFIIKLKDEPWYYSYAPIIKIIRFFARKKIDYEKIKDVLSKHKLSDGSCIYAIQDKNMKNLNMYNMYDLNKHNLIILKIPARCYISIPEYTDLIILKKLAAKGCYIKIIILDIPYIDGLRPDININAWCDYTSNIIKNTLGSIAEVNRLSEILAKQNRFNDFTKFLFERFIPYYANNVKNLSLTVDERYDNSTLLHISYLVFPFLLKGISYYPTSKYNTFVLQFNQRLSKWEQYDTSIIKDIPGFKLAGHVAIKSFIAYNKEKLRTSIHLHKDYSFNMTDDMDKIKKNILSYSIVNKKISWEIADLYIDYLSGICLGIYVDKSNINFSTSSQNLTRFINEEDSALSNWLIENESASLNKRYAFYHEFKKVRNKLCKSQLQLLPSNIRQMMKNN